jgi:hypothetical protein
MNPVSVYAIIALCGVDRRVLALDNKIENLGTIV